jgi:hypothetical protein
MIILDIVGIIVAITIWGFLGYFFYKFWKYVYTKWRKKEWVKQDR